VPAESPSPRERIAGLVTKLVYAELDAERVRLESKNGRDVDVEYAAHLAGFAKDCRAAVDEAIDALVRDAERYRYLADRRAEVHQRPYTLTLHVNSFVSLDEHIDAARATTPSGGEPR
jgi:hypothetical protein